MPGLIGVTNKNNVITAKQILRARASMKDVQERCKDDILFQDENIIATRTHLNFIGEKTSPIKLGNVFCWVEGEIYNTEEIKSIFDFTTDSFAEILLISYSNNILEKVLGKIDGYFSAVIYDKTELQINLISDRYGLKPLYFYHRNGLFFWSSEVKGFLPLEPFRPEINPEAVNCFMDVGHMIGNLTWLKNVEMLFASAVLTYDINKGRILKKSRYWNWSEIKPEKIEFDDASVTLGKLIKKSVNKRIHPSKKIGVSLSGGLDSRAILSSIDDASNVFTYTFGAKDSLDAEIASMVAQIKKSPHLFIELNENNWLDNRFRGIWRSDGMLHFMHMQGCITHNKIIELCNISLYGTRVGGGYFLKKLKNKQLNKRISKSSASLIFGSYIKHDDTDDSFYDVDHIDPYFINNRIRMFTNRGCIAVSEGIEHRNPLLDNDIVEFTFSLPDEYRINTKIYNQSLLYTFPEMYSKIPWEKTGFPISKKITPLTKTFKEIERFSVRIGLQKRRKMLKNREWINSPAALNFMKKILEPSGAIYPDYVRENILEKYLIPHSNGDKNYSEQIGRAMTMELWFQQVFNRKYIE